MKLKTNSETRVTPHPHGADRSNSNNSTRTGLEGSNNLCVRPFGQWSKSLRLCSFSSFLLSLPRYGRLLLVRPAFHQRCHATNNVLLKTFIELLISFIFQFYYLAIVIIIRWHYLVKFSIISSWLVLSFFSVLTY